MKVSTYPTATSITGTDTVAGVVAGATAQIPVSLLQAASLGGVWPLDIPPTSPHAKDDEFTGNSLDAKWTNPITSAAGCNLTLAVSNGWVLFEPATAGTSSTGKLGAFGIRQVSPTGSFTISAKIEDLLTESSDNSVAGIWVGIGGNRAWVLGYNTSSPAIAYALEASTYSEAAEWGAYTAGTNTSVALATTTTRNGKWYRIKYEAGTTTLSFYYSPNGVDWKLLTTATGVAQPTRMGLGIWSSAANVLAHRQLGCGWFRVTEP